jgi:PAS domain S-box-containing protein
LRRTNKSTGKPACRSQRGRKVGATASASIPAAWVFSAAALLGCGISGFASWLLMPTATTLQAEVTPTTVYLLFAAMTLLWVTAASVAWLVIRRLQDQVELLAESRERNRAIVDNMVDGAIHIDGNGRLVALNRAAEQMFGYQSQGLRGKALATLLAPGDHSDIDHLLSEGSRHPADKRVVSNAFEVTGKRNNGEAFPLYLAISEVKTGGYPVFTAIARDLTETRRRIAELAEARDQAMAADKAKSQFLAVMSHEIRTPMNGILGMLDLLRDGSLSQRQQEFLDTAEQSSNMLLSIINDILDLSKIEAGKLELQAIDFDLRTHVEEVTALVASDAVNKAIEIASFVEPDVPEQVRGDPYRVRQILLNLMGNAVKFTQQGEVLAHVSAQSDDHGLLIHVKIRDTGIGIDPQVATRLFQPFTQADTTTTRRFGGTGLGLVISKRLVNLMGGEIGVASKPNQGSTFWFTLRLAEAGRPIQQHDRDLRGVSMTQPTARSPTTRREGPQPRFRAKLLVAEDNAVNQKVVLMMLRRYGIEAQVAANGKLAVEAVMREQDYDLLFMDVQMPVMGGNEATRRIRALEREMHRIPLPIIAMTASASDKDRDACIKAGMDDFIAKPIQKRQLETALARWLPPRAKLPPTRVDHAVTR